MIDFPEKDDVNRLIYLYAEIHEDEKDENIPKDIINFWKNSVQRYCLEKTTLKFTVEDLQHAFTSMGIIPVSILRVVRVLLREKDLLDAEKLVATAAADTNDTGLLASVMSSLWSYSSSIFQSAEQSAKAFSSKEFLNGMLLSDIEQSILRYVSSLSNDSSSSFYLIHNQSTFPLSFPHLVRKSLELCHPDDMKWKAFIEAFHDYDNLLNYMEMKKSLIRIDDKIIQIIKKPPTAPSSSKVSSTESDDVALAKFRLQLSLHQINEYVDNLQKKISDYQIQALKAKVLYVIFLVVCLICLLLETRE
jgi:hypothetical protein